MLDALRNPKKALIELDRIDCEESLAFFVQRFWHILEPNRDFIDGWPFWAICDHLEAVFDGRIVRLLENVCPGFMKSLLTNVFFVAWCWGPKRRPDLRFLAFSYAAHLTERDNAKLRDLLLSPEYQEMFGDRFRLTETGKVKLSTSAMGWKLATSIGGVGTGERADIICCDDPHSVKDSESDTIRNETVRWFREAMSNRLNDPEKSAIVVIMQRVHQDDVSGAIIHDMLDDYVWLKIPMEWDGVEYETPIGWRDPRTEIGELAWPERFSRKAVDSLKATMGPWAFATQYQQIPAPRGGGIFREEWWNDWTEETFPKCDFTVASLDGAFGEKKENDYSALTVWGVFHDSAETANTAGPHWADLDAQWEAIRKQQIKSGTSRVILMHAWRGRKPLHAPRPVPNPKAETQMEYRRRREDEIGLVEKVIDICKKFKVDRLLVEAKANGIDVAREVQRLMPQGQFSVELVDPKGDKVARAYAVQPIFAEGMVYAPHALPWFDMVCDEMEAFPKASHDDLCDSATMACRWLRERGLLMREAEAEYDYEMQSAYRPMNAKPLYPS